MKTWRKVVATSLMSVLAVGTLAGCGSLSGEKKSSKDDKDSPTLLMYQIGDKPKNYEALIEVANKRIEEKINAKVNIQYIGWGDYEQKMSVIVSSGENYDIALAKNFVANAQKGAYADLTDLLPKYAKEAYDDLDESYIKGNSVDGKMYALPVNANIFSQQMLTFNKQYLDKYDLDISKVNSYADIAPLLKTIKEKEPNVMPMAAGQGFRAEVGLDFPLANGLPFAIDVDGDATKIINPFSSDKMMAAYESLHDYYQAGYIAKDAATSNTEYPLNTGSWFVRQETQGPFDYGDTALTTAAGQALVSRAITPALKTTQAAQMASFVVSSGSKNTEKAVEFLGLLNSDPELLNGLVLGIEGEAWEKVGDNRSKLLDGYKPDMHMSAWNTANNKVLYVDESISDKQIKERDDAIAAAKESPILGFVFDTKDVKNEISNLNNVMSQYLDGLNTGTLDPKKAVPEMNDKLEKAGLAKVTKEMQKQYDAFR
ncbi:ABC transporter substrate-binding protein [Brochothrix campestris]|uniref:Bacterial extracellular solute-binding family protein n=1 Tax=Brochothrix campestris FSL F6-1037 TaxID=1265861 RepID=W7CZ94_9LIST|nr:ABC transporter substrate-binding protein [Brochothrix campestris]EUJ42090.1 bacterial extracellular solute-binding family protein [Brochothrix campestris FSL F6-1037]